MKGRQQSEFSREDILNLIKTNLPEDLSKFIAKLGSKEFISLPLDDEGNTALHIAAQSNPPIIPYLLENGADPTILNAKGESVFRLYIDNCFVSNAMFEAICRDLKKSGILTLNTRQDRIKFSQELNRNQPEARERYALEMIHGTFIPDTTLHLLQKKADVNTVSKHGETILHVFAAQYPEWIDNLIKLSADLLKLDANGRNIIRIYLDNGYFSELILDHIQTGLNVNTQNAQGVTLLYVATFKYPKFISRLLDLGADPNIKFKNAYTAFNAFMSRASFMEDDIDYAMPLIKLWPDIKLTDKTGRNILEIVMTKEYFSDEAIDVVLSLIQMGLSYDRKKEDCELLLTTIYERYPDVKKYILSQKIPENEIDSSNYIFKHIDIAALRLEIKYRSTIHQARNEFLNFLLVLARDLNDPTSDSLFKKIPHELLYLIISCCDFNAMQKMSKDGVLLAHSTFTRHDEIKKMMTTYGGINAFQRKEITFFKSTECLYLDYNKLTKSDDITPVKLNKFSEQAAGCYQQHLSLFKLDKSKIALAKRIEGTAFEKAIRPVIKQW